MREFRSRSAQTSTLDDTHGSCDISTTRQHAWLSENLSRAAKNCSWLVPPSPVESRCYRVRLARIWRALRDRVAPLDPSRGRSGERTLAQASVGAVGTLADQAAAGPVAVVVVRQ
jgi:hypothetical protein